MKSTDATRLIAFSLYGNDSIYLVGALENARLARDVYPRWTARFYVSQEISEDLIKDLAMNGAEIRRMTRRGVADGMLWRLLAADEMQAEAVIFRDVDSRISTREALAVDEWLSSNTRFHVMRDHPRHNSPIMGGMWGLIPGSLPPISTLIRKWRLRRFVGYKVGPDGWGLDQTFLRSSVYPIARDDAMIHSEFVRFEGETVRPFPAPPAEGEFVGQIVRADGSVDRNGISIRAEHGGVFDAGPVPGLDPLSRAQRLVSRLWK